MKLNAIIIEDESVSRDILRNYTQKYCPDVTIVAEAANIKEGLELINKHQPDFIFLDVEMPYGNAFDLLDQIPDRNFEVIFVTAYNHYAIDALNQHAAYYLMKPIDIDELIKAVQYISEIHEKEQQLHDEVLQPRVAKTDGKITIPQQDGFEVIAVDSIYFCKADDNYTELFFENKKLLVSKTLKYFDDLLTDFSFVRVHKSYLVNVSKVIKYKKGKGGSVVLSNGKEIMVSASKKSDLLSYFQ
ncbi:two component transcriptional regulator, LytTR family [Pustulibacterium marinum]|uniref:Two component transcriptional regulator, LytTR family n=1 Tax=Pustulibacterium marinum TaxID=1224947 RepID=A0A1I7GRD5_9FLAO|nr:LytTR family DNA-binding domain-containing protein [Pustulibacterium marinum]SFU51014.1 two component transcriptional regulator, LytTR family [Pustulibacterium marinum]